MNPPKQRVAWDPPPPDETPTPKVDVWMLPVTSLSVDALRFLLDTFSLDAANLLRAKQLLCDGREHLLLRGEYEDLAVAMIRDASRFAIPLELRPCVMGS
jgi:hypothetical protein